MTESEWLDCADPDPMLKLLRDRSGDRKLRLFALACCSRIDRLITHPDSRAALEFAERHLESGVAQRRGRATMERAARKAHRAAYTRMMSASGGVERARGLIVSNAFNAAAAILNRDPYFAALYAAAFSAWALAWEAQVAAGTDTYPDLPNEFKRSEERHQAGLLRCIFNPFRTFVQGLPCRTPTIRALAQAAYEERILPSGELDPARLAVLADALEEAACSEQAILDHLRGIGPHVRGCFALDLIRDRS
jgi:hypothetical protein